MNHFLSNSLNNELFFRIECGEIIHKMNKYHHVDSITYQGIGINESL